MNCIRNMKNLIKAFTILSKYTKDPFPTCCEHDVLYVPVVDYDAVSEEDKAELKSLGFTKNTDGGQGFMSYHYGSC
jgi:hypothetical protein